MKTVTSLNSTLRIGKKVTDNLDELLKIIKEGEDIDRDDWRVKNLSEKSKELLAPIFLQSDIKRDCKNMLDHLVNVNTILNIIDDDFPYPCGVCGCQSFRVIKSWRYVNHYAQIRCNNCNTHGQWITQEDVENRTTKLTRKLHMTDNFNTINHALGI